MFTYQEGNEASYFIISKDYEGGAADVGPSGVGASKESPMASSSRGWVTEPSASEGEPDILVMEPSGQVKSFLRSLLELLPLLPRFLLWGLLELGVVAEAVEAVSLMISSPLDNTLIICKQSFLSIIMPYFNEVLLQVFHL